MPTIFLQLAARNLHTMTELLPHWIKSIILPQDHPSVAASIILLFSAMFLGILVGKVKIKKVSLGISGIVFIGILLGHMGYKIQAETYEFMRDFGLILFVYAIGMQVGPSFFNHLKNDGILYNSLATITVTMAGVCSLGIFSLTGVPMDIMVGIMSGAVTNTPGLGAAKAAIHDLQINVPNHIFNDPTNAYAIAYPFGIFGIILLMILGKYLFKINPQKEADLFSESIRLKHPAPESGKCRVTNSQYFGKTIQEFLSNNNLKVIITRIKNTGSTLVESPNKLYVLRERDVLMMVGLPQDIEQAIAILGYRSKDTFIESDVDTQSKTFLITRESAIQKSIAQLNLEGQYHVKTTRVYRTGLEMLAHPELVLHYGDRLRVVGHANDLDVVGKFLGNSEKKLQEPQLLSIFIGVVLGVILGSAPLLLPGLSVPVKLGMAAGPLLVSILISRFGGIKSFHSYLQQSALLLMKEIGICIFFAAIGLHAGETFYESFILNNGWIWVLYGLIITLTPILFLMIMARYVFKLNYMPLLGLIAGSYTDPAALDFCTHYFKSELPVQAYATVYPLVTILRIILAQVLILYFTL